MNYYQSIDKTFAEITQAVMDFASRDAQRTKLRDEMRAEAIISFIRENGLQEKSIYIEAGYIHFALRPALMKRQEGRPDRVKQTFVLWQNPAASLATDSGEGRLILYLYRATF